MARINRLLERAKKLKPRRRDRSWVSALPTKERNDLEGLRTAFNDGVLPIGLTKVQLYEDMIEKKYDISQTTFNSWLRGGRRSRK